MTFAPIALFTYNRLPHVRLTVEALLRNPEARESELFIFSDAAKNEDGMGAVDEVRHYLRRVTGFSSVQIIERRDNFGLARSIIDGVSSICDRHGRVIVLEDDIVTSPHFLRFMNEALAFYEQDHRVISVQGYWFPVKEKLPETFFLRGADCWGWATWKRGWRLFEPDGRKLMTSLAENHLEREFNYDGGYDYTGMLAAQIKGDIDSWAIRWHASAFVKNKLSLYPARSLVRNIGTDGSGVHCGTTGFFSGEMTDRPVTVGAIPVVGNQAAYASVAKYFRSSKSWLARRIIDKIRRPLGFLSRSRRGHSGHL